jgi:hypothetical protein
LIYQQPIAAIEDDPAYLSQTPLATAAYAFPQTMQAINLPVDDPVQTPLAAVRATLSPV